jgi:hypothetical protein
MSQSMSKTALIKVRTTAAERAALEDQARRMRTTMSALLREGIAAVERLGRNPLDIRAEAVAIRRQAAAIDFVAGDVGGIHADRLRSISETLRRIAGDRLGGGL